jgi:hypothetical protein
MDSHSTTNGQKTVEYGTFYDTWQITASLQLDYPRNVTRNEVSLLKIKCVLQLENSYYQSVKNVLYLHQNQKTYVVKIHKFVSYFLLYKDEILLSHHGKTVD